LTDGANDDPRSMSLTVLLRVLRAEQDLQRPVSVTTIAYGTGSATAPLAQISRATGGTAYVVTDPRQIQQVFLDALGQRLCRPHC
jgi:Ca-activated chloride channel homolog